MTCGIDSLGSALAYDALVRTILRANHHDQTLNADLARNLMARSSQFGRLTGIAGAPLTTYLPYASRTLLSLMWIIPNRQLVREHQHETASGS